MNSGSVEILPLLNGVHSICISYHPSHIQQVSTPKSFLKFYDTLLTPEILLCAGVDTGTAG